jgi:hypothetical protein
MGIPAETSNSSDQQVSVDPVMLTAHRDQNVTLNWGACAPQNWLRYRIIMKMLRELPVVPAPRWLAAEDIKQTAGMLAGTNRKKKALGN